MDTVHPPAPGNGSAGSASFQSRRDRTTSQRVDVSRTAFVLLAAVQMTLIAAISLVAVALPAIQAELAVNTTFLTLVSAGYGLTFSGLLVLGGRLADAWGHRRAFTLGLVVFGLASLAGLWSPGLWVLLVARFVQGAGAALVAPAALALAGQLFPEPHERERALARAGRSRWRASSCSSPSSPWKLARPSPSCPSGSFGDGSV